MTATRTFDLVLLLLGAVATAAALLVIHPVGTGGDIHPVGTAGDPGVTAVTEGFRDFGGIATLDGTTEDTLARFREMDPERLASLHRHHDDRHHDH